jgi:hypothetical protein
MRSAVSGPVAGLFALLLGSSSGHNLAERSPLDDLDPFEGGKHLKSGTHRELGEMPSSVSCESCVDAGSSVSDCMALGILDCCSAYKQFCSCTKCVCKGNEKSDCEGFGLDCSCFTEVQNFKCTHDAMFKSCGDNDQTTTEQCVACTALSGCSDSAVQ